MYVLIDIPVFGSLLEAASDGQVMRAGFANVTDLTVAPVRTTGIGVAPNGGIALARGPDVLLRGFNWTGDDILEARFSVGAIGWGDNEALLLGSIDGAVIDAYDPADGTFRRLLGPSDDPDAQVELDEPLGPIVSLLAMPDERIVFVADTADGYQLYVLDEHQARLVETDQALGRSGPVASTGARPSDRTIRADRFPMEPLAPAPASEDSQVLTTGLGPDGHPQIALVDVDSGTVEVLAELEDVEPTTEQPISAAAVGDDLIFLAEARIWKLENAFA